MRVGVTVRIIVTVPDSEWERVHEEGVTDDEIKAALNDPDTKWMPGNEEEIVTDEDARYYVEEGW